MEIELLMNEPPGSFEKTISKSQKIALTYLCRKHMNVFTKYTFKPTTRIRGAIFFLQLGHFKFSFRIFVEKLKL